MMTSKLSDKKYAVRLTYDQMNLIYRALQIANASPEDLKQINVAMRVAQISYGVRGGFYDC